MLFCVHRASLHSSHYCTVAAVYLAWSFLAWQSSAAAEGTPSLLRMYTIARRSTTLAKRSNTALPRPTPRRSTFLLAWHPQSELPRNAGFDTPPVSYQLLVLASTRYLPAHSPHIRRLAVASHLVPLSANSKVTHRAVRPCGVTTSFVTLGCLRYDTCWLRLCDHYIKVWLGLALEACCSRDLSAALRRTQHHFASALSSSTGWAASAGDVVAPSWISSSRDISWPFIAES